MPGGLFAGVKAKAMCNPGSLALGLGRCFYLCSGHRAAEVGKDQQEKLGAQDRAAEQAPKVHSARPWEGHGWGSPGAKQFLGQVGVVAAGCWGHERDDNFMMLCRGGKEARSGSWLAALSIWGPQLLILSSGEQKGVKRNGWHHAVEQGDREVIGDL